MKLVIKWILRGIMLWFVAFAGMRAYAASVQTIQNISGEGSDGQVHVLTCTAFDYGACLRFEKGLVDAGYSSLASRPNELQEQARRFQMLTFMWGAVSLLLMVGIAFTFRRSAKSPQITPESDVS